MEFMYTAFDEFDDTFWNIVYNRHKIMVIMSKQKKIEQIAKETAKILKSRN